MTYRKFIINVILSIVALFLLGSCSFVIYSVFVVS